MSVRSGCPCQGIGGASRGAGAPSSLTTPSLVANLHARVWVFTSTPSPNDKAPDAQHADCRPGCRPRDHRDPDRALSNDRRRLARSEAAISGVVSYGVVVLSVNV